MNRTVHFAKNCFKTSIAVIVALATTSVSAHETGYPHNSKSGDKSSLIQIEQIVTKHKAKKITRKFLTSRGFTKNIAPGGAQIRKIESAGEFWMVEVGLRNDSAANLKKEKLFISKRNGVVMERLPESAMLANLTKSN